MKQVDKKQKQKASRVPTQTSGIAKKQSKPSVAKPEPAYARAIVVAAILVVTFIAFYPSLNNGLLKTWDDQAYVTRNDLVKSLSGSNIVKIFKEDKGMYANYHPLTTLSLAVNYQFSKDDPFGYHLTNLLLHLLNTLLVFIFIYVLSRNRLEVAAITAMLFGLAPVHIESVAWISERKDVLYACFFLASLIAYLQYVRKSDWKVYLFSLVLFLCSMLSKAMAASLPVVLILIDLVERRRWSLKTVAEKVPYFALAIILGIYAVRIQAEGNAIGSVMFPLGMRIFHACYGFSAYIFKIFAPTGLSAFYPYPYPLVNGAWVTNLTPSIFYLTFAVTMVILCFSIYAVFSRNNKFNILGFGWLFYAVTIALVLQFLPVGRAIMADRYAYVPSAGLFFIIGYFAGDLYRKRSYRVPVLVFFAAYAGLLFYQTRGQITVWKNDETLWNNVIDIYPSDNRVVIAYANRANYFQEEGKPREALKDLLLVAGWNPMDDNSLEKIGKIYGKDLNDLGNAIKYFQLAYKANPKNIEVIKDLATVYGIMGNFNQSLEYSLMGLEMSKDDALLMYNAGASYSNLGQLEKGQALIRKAIEKDPTLRRN